VTSPKLDQRILKLSAFISPSFLERANDSALAHSQCCFLPNLEKDLKFEQRQYSRQRDD
jgi:hypothetical protein